MQGDEVNPFSKIINIEKTVFKVWVKRELLYCHAVSVGDGEGSIVLNTINNVDVGGGGVGREFKVYSLKFNSFKCLRTNLRAKVAITGE